MWPAGSSSVYSSVPAPTPSRSRSSAAPQRMLSQDAVSRRLALLRQHRSMEDAAEDMYGLEEPLSISTAGHPSHRSSAPLSNPIPSAHAYWANPSGQMKGCSLEMEYAQLRLDYETAIEKLNQTMYSIKTFWSPELKRERQIRREEATRIALLEDRLTQLTGGGVQSNLHESSTGRILELEETCKRLAENLKNKEQQVAALCMDTGGGRRALENALRHLDEKTERVLALEEEVMDLRAARASKPRDFTEKGATGHELVTLRMKLERSEVELSEKKAEFATCQTRLRNAEDELAELRAHAQLVKEHASSKDDQCALLQADVEALRGKLELRHQMIEQKESRIAKLESELTESRKESTERLESLRSTESRYGQLVGRVESVEGQLREKEVELERVKQRLAAHPDTQREKQLISHIENGERARARLEQAVDEVRINAEKEHKQQLDTYQTEAARMRTTIETLEKELADRDVLLESQNEKIGDMGRELTATQQRIQASMVDKSNEELRKELESARGEVEKLLRMLHTMEKENALITSKYKQLMGSQEERNKRADLESMGGGLCAASGASAKQRIQELEQALAESVSITAEREVLLCQQKQLLQQTSNQLGDCRREVKELRQKLSTVAGEEHEAMIKSIEAERKQHLEQLMALKQEALLSAIAEKEAHVSLLERGNAPRDQIETIRRQKEALMRKLKQENDRRQFVLHSNASSLPMVRAGLVGSAGQSGAAGGIMIRPGMPSAYAQQMGMAADMTPGMSHMTSQPGLVRAQSAPPHKGDDETEGIWA